MLSLHRFSICLPLLIALFSSQALAGDENSVTVSGIGVATVAPDIARVQMSVVERNASLETAQQAAADATARVLDLTDRLGIDRAQVNTTSASVRPDYRWINDRRERELIGYIAERRIEVEVRDLDKLGELIEGAVKVGVNQVRSPVLDSTQRRETYRRALALAAEDARANATTLAAALDTGVGEVIAIDANGGHNQPPRPMMAMSADAAMAEVAPETYSAGDIRFEVRLTAVFELKD